MNKLPPKIADIVSYQEWERRAGPYMQARYTDLAPQSPLFDVRVEDIPVTIPGYRIETSGDNVITVTAPDGRGVSLRGLTSSQLAAALSLIDGKTPIADLALVGEPHAPLAAWQKVIQALLGSVVNLPATFSSLARGIMHTEIVRFPIQPAHAVLRSYWENSAVVRAELPVFYSSFGETASFLAALGNLHMLATTGGSGQSFYGGYGLIPTVPGGYREISVQTAIPGSLVRTLEHWAALLGAGPMTHDGELQTPSGQTMCIVRERGTIVLHLATGAELQALLDEARTALAAAHGASTETRVPETLDRLAMFHQIFVNAHPFSNINHSVAMNIVNDCLRRAGLGFLPHLLLDYLAQRLSPGQFRAAFAMAVRLHALGVGESTAEAAAASQSSTLYLRYRTDRDGTAPNVQNGTPPTA
jgi:hypothetical protein